RLLQSLPDGVECEPISRGDQRMYLAGIDDAHYYRVDAHDEFSILLSHTPEVYRQAAHAGLNFVLRVHTHRGNYRCLDLSRSPLSSVLPRHMGSGSAKYHGMAGYTSVPLFPSGLTVAGNCAPPPAMR